MITTVIRPRLLLAQWVRDQIADADRTDLPTLVEEAVEHFRRDEVFVQAFLREGLQPLVYDIAHRVMLQSRQEPMSGEQYIATATTIERKGAFDERIRLTAKWEAKWRKWQEYNGTHHVRLLAMTTVDLDGAIKDREQRAETEGRRALFLRLLMSKLPVGKKVREHYDNHQIGALWMKAMGEEKSNGHLRGQGKRTLDGVQGTTEVPQPN